MAGVPARIIRYRFDDEIIERLLEIEWWNWDEHAIKNKIELWKYSVTLEVLSRLNAEGSS